MPYYQPSTNRYTTMQYKRCGRSGLQLPALSLGLWQNFGATDDYNNCREMLRFAFDNGITHFDLANNYGPPPGSAESTFGKMLKTDFLCHRDELIISSKAGYKMWEGPYGDWGSKKYMVASIDQSLRRTGLEYFDIFYHHRPDPATSIEETMAALSQMVRQGKALYIGISNYRPAEAAQAISILKDLGTPCVIHQPRYSMYDRWVEDGLLELLKKEGIGCIPFSPLAQGLLTDKYLNGIPEGSRVTKGLGFLKESQVTPEKIEKSKALNEIAKERSQTLAQMALSWILKDKRITSVLVGASSAAQLADSLKSLAAPVFTAAELAAIEHILAR